jgi:hypothetical protein
MSHNRVIDIQVGSSVKVKLKMIQLLVLIILIPGFYNLFRNLFIVLSIRFSLNARLVRFNKSDLKWITGIIIGIIPIIIIPVAGIAIGLPILSTCIKWYLENSEGVYDNGIYYGNKIIIKDCIDKYFITKEQIEISYYSGKKNHRISIINGFILAEYLDKGWDSAIKVSHGE